MSPEEKKGPILPLVALGVILALAAGYYYWMSYEQPAPPPPPPAEAPAPQAPAEPPIRHPLQRPETADAKPLPPLGDSDEVLRNEAAALIGKGPLERFFHLNSIVRRFVVTVDDLPRRKLSQKYSLAKPVAGEFAVQRKGEEIFLSPDNYRRYTPYVKLAEAVDARKLVALYVHFYPLIQEEYRNLGYPKNYFNDRLVEAIDDLLATPEIREPIKLLQPKVMYEFDSARLEALSAGQKLMIRMGPENAARIKARLREIRQELTSGR